MLFDPKWHKTEANCDITFDNFRNWVEAQNPKARYRYRYKANCAVGRWLKAIDYPRYIHADWGRQPLYLFDYMAAKSPHTFGALAQRLRALADSERPF